ncbi:MAG: transcription termination factor NusA [Phascolarctobacterium sp.]|nr:transcription termination factor NusA [Phascolarctobacterium sp.]
MNADFISAIQELGKEKGIDSELLFQAVEEALVTAYKKKFGSAQNVRVDMNKDTGEIHVLAQRLVVDNNSSVSANEISLDEAKAIDYRYEVGDVVEVEATPKNFGRIATQNAKQVVVQRIREAERGMVYERFSSRENDIVTGVIQRMENKNVYIDLGKVEAILTPNEQINGEIYQYHDRMKTYIIEVKRTNKGPQIMVSRTHPGLLKRLFELEVPEIHDGVVEIKSVAREPGMRSKISVCTDDDNIDPVGACVGHKGMRVQTIVNELRGEKIDIVKYSEDPAQYVANALSPAKVVSTDINDEEKICRVVVPDYQLSLAIGKEGQNARLAAKLTGWKIDIKSESQATTDNGTEDDENLNSKEYLSSEDYLNGEKEFKDVEEDEN